MEDGSWRLEYFSPRLSFKKKSSGCQLTNGWDATVFEWAFLLDKWWVTLVSCINFEDLEDFQRHSSMGPSVLSRVETLPHLLKILTNTLHITHGLMMLPISPFYVDPVLCKSLWFLCDSLWEILVLYWIIAILYSEEDSSKSLMYKNIEKKVVQKILTLQFKERMWFIVQFNGL